MRALLLLIFLICISSCAVASTTTEAISAIEKRIDGRIGVAVLNSSDDQIWHYKGNQKFPLMSTFKTLACSKMLKMSEDGQLNINMEKVVEKNSLVVWSPVTKALVGKAITLAKACEATMLTSDNTAANIVLANIGGPSGVTSFMRLIGDMDTRLDRIEPDLNEAIQGDMRDTTTPKVMVNSLQQIFFGGTISQKASDQLTTWMQKNTISDALLRSVLPEGWYIADRTGAGGNGSRAITAIIWSESHSPIIVAIYVTETELTLSERNQVIAEVGAVIVNTLGLQHRQLDFSALD